MTGLANHLREQLTCVEGIQGHDQGERKCGIVTFTAEGTTAQAVQRRLRELEINVSVSLVDYARLDLPTRGLPDLVRASVHYYNTTDELDRLITTLSRD